MKKINERVVLKEKHEQKRLHFFAYFADMDIDVLDLSGVINLEVALLAVVSGYAAGDWVQVSFADQDGEVEKRKKAALKAFQSDFRGRFHDVMDRITHAEDAEQREWTEDGRFFSGYYEGGIFEAAPPVPGLRVDLVDAPVRTEFDTSSYVEIPGEYDGEKARWSRDWHEKSRIRTRVRPLLSPQDTFFFRFLEALDGIKLSSCIRCTECGRFFFNLTRRKKVFCSHACASRFGVRRGRALKKMTDPHGYEKELAQNRERARKAYLRKVRAKTPNARVTKRPHRKKRA